MTIKVATQQKNRKGARAASRVVTPVRETNRLPETNRLTNRLKPGQHPIDAMAGLVVAGILGNARMSVHFSGSIDSGDVDLTACFKALTESTERVNRGDLAQAEAILMAQAVTLNAMFVDMLNRGMSCQYVENLERYIRFGLRAQAQCRATLETLATIKNPPTVIAKQANIANGPQQVNNTAQLPASRARAIAESAPTELLEAACRTDGHRNADGGRPRRSDAGNRGSRRPVHGLLKASDGAR
jgi:hypothetical protein